MKIVEEYRHRAAEAERLAESTICEDHRQLILEVTRIWRTMADQREWQLKSGLGEKPPTCQ
jgi:hypothetical protein